MPGKSHGRRSLVGCSPRGRQESDTTERLPFHFSLSCTGEGNGNPLQRSCLENPRDGGAWWAAVYGVVQSQTRLKRLSSSSSSSSRTLSNMCLQLLAKMDSRAEAHGCLVSPIIGWCLLLFDPQRVFLSMCSQGDCLDCKNENTWSLYLLSGQNSAPLCPSITAILKHPPEAKSSPLPCS